MEISYVAFAVLHLAQFALAITVCGLYGVDLSRARAEGKYADSRWVFAVVVAGLSAVTAVAYLHPRVPRSLYLSAWNLLLFIFWVIVFGIFGRMYIHEDAEGNADIERMRSAVWVDLANMLFWLVATLAFFFYWLRHRRTRSMFTSRARVA